MLVFIFLLYGGLTQMMFLFRCLWLLLVFIFICYLSLCLYLDLSKASWYQVKESLKISSEKNNDKSRDWIEIGSYLIIKGGWLDTVFMYSI